MTHDEARTQFVATHVGTAVQRVWELVYEVKEIGRARNCCAPCYERQIAKAEEACRDAVAETLSLDRHHSAGA